MTEPPNTAQCAEAHTYLLPANYELFVVGIVIITMANDLLAILKFDVEVTTVAGNMNAFLIAFLFFDACMRLLRRDFGLRWLVRGGGWLVFLGSIPFPFFGLARLLRTVWTIRKFRRSDLLDAEMSIRVGRAQSTLLGVVLLAIVGFEVAGITILLVEDGQPGANIVDASDALWWSYVTIATVGYGDRYPVSVAGRITGAVVITLGVALFSTITGFLSDWFRRPRAGLPFAQSPVDDSDDLRGMLTELRQTLEAQTVADQAALSELRERLERIEQRLNSQ